MPFIGPVDIANMKTSPYDEDIVLSWDCLNPNAEVTIYAATDNLYKTGGQDEWIKLGTVPASYQSYQVKSRTIADIQVLQVHTANAQQSPDRWINK